MKLLNIGLAILGGACLGAALGVIFAPDKGENTRYRIKKYLKEHGIDLPKNKIDEVVDQIEAELASEK